MPTEAPLSLGFVPVWPASLGAILRPRELEEQLPNLGFASQGGPECRTAVCRGVPTFPEFLDYILFGKAALVAKQQHAFCNGPPSFPKGEF